MGSNDGNRVSRAPLSTDSEGDNSRRIASEVVFAARSEGRSPRVALTDKLKTGLFEASRGRLNGVISWIVLVGIKVIVKLR
jgi:hypothetical protein